MTITDGLNMEVACPKCVRHGALSRMPPGGLIRCLYTDCGWTHRERCKYPTCGRWTDYPDMEYCDQHRILYDFINNLIAN